MHDTIRTSGTRFVKHIADSTALLVPATPVFAAQEIFLAGMSTEVSLKSKLIIAGVTYLGGGAVVSLGRDLFKKLFGINSKSSEKAQNTNDLIYFAALNIPSNLLLYYLSGERDGWKLAAGTLLSSGLAALLGPVVGYTMDAYNDIFGIKTCERQGYTRYIKNRRPFTKVGLAALSVTASVAFTYGIYTHATDK